MKDNLPMLEVKALGGFSMRYGEKTISIGSGKSTKAVKLLQILLCSEGRTVSRERLLDMLYGNEDITDAENRRLHDDILYFAGNHRKSSFCSCIPQRCSRSFP